MVKKIFISYRRNDTPAAARILCERFRAFLGHRNVFLDVDTIKGGENYLTKIGAELAKSDTVLVLIGSRWLEVSEGGGQSRLWSDGDHVRAEVRSALSSGAHVFPILVDGTKMVDPALLPDDVRSLTGRNALPLRHESFDSDVDRIMRATLGLRESEPVWRDRGRASVKIGFGFLGAAIASCALVAAAALHFYLLRRPIQVSLGGVYVTFGLIAAVAAIGVVSGLRYEEARRKRRMGANA